MPSIDPKTATWIMAAFTLIGIAGQTPMPVWIPMIIAVDIQSTCVWLALLGNGVGTALHMISSASSGPMVK